MDQLIKKEGIHQIQNVYPTTFIEAIKDEESGVSLKQILHSYNMYFVAFDTDVHTTRLSVPISLRKQGLWITYVDTTGHVFTEYYDYIYVDDDAWKNSSNWRGGDNFLVGDITVSSDGFWVINGEVTTTKAQGPQGISPLLRTQRLNKLEVSYDEGKVWSVISDHIAAWFRWYEDRIQISRDNKVTWEDFSGSFTNNFSIKGYVSTVAELPKTEVLGTLYLVGPTNGRYRLYVYTSEGWHDSGEFAGITVGVIQTLGQSTTEVPSQKLLTDELDKLYNSVVICTEQEYNDLTVKAPEVFYFTYEEE